MTIPSISNTGPDAGPHSEPDTVQGSGVHCTSATTGAVTELPTPASYRAREPLTTNNTTRVAGHRAAISSILRGEDQRMLAIVGPCSVHSVAQALDYADQLAAAQPRLDDALLIAMRVYIEKPRTTTGWRGLALDPALDSSAGPDIGLHESRRVMKGVIERGLPVATESLDPIILPYVEDLLAFSSLGARTSESQTHRQMAAAMACPVGIKNATCGSLSIATDAAVAAQSTQPVFRLTAEGKVAYTPVSGNRNTAIVLRGGAQGPNYSVEHQAQVRQLLKQRGIDAGLIIDCSHGNSGKIADRQMDVVDYISRQILSEGQHEKPNAKPNIGALDTDCRAPVGVMIESHLYSGKQPAGPLSTLHYGVSITDECLGFTDTIGCLEKLADAVRSRSKRPERTCVTA